MLTDTYKPNFKRLWDTQVSLTNLRGVEVAELTEENVPLIKNPLQYAEGLYHFLLEIWYWNYSSSVTSTSGLTAFIIPVASKKVSRFNNFIVFNFKMVVAVNRKTFP